jgi:EmrB/QacA subfamily drug resistance transporter
LSPASRAHAGAAGAWAGATQGRSLGKFLRPGAPVALLVAGAMFMEQFDGTVIAPALPQMAASFGVAPVDLNVGISAYLLTVAVFIPASGWITDRFGGRAVFAAAVTLFTVASVLCSLSTTLSQFAAARILQGIGGAMMVPVGRLVVLRSTEKQHLIRAIALLTWPALAAPVLGPPLGGLITTYATWHWIFLINVPLGLAGLVLAFVLVPDTRGETAAGFDWSGFVLCGGASFAWMWGLETIGRGRIDWLLTAPLLTIGIVAGAASIRHMRVRPRALLDFRPFRVPTFAIPVGAGLLVRGAISAAPFLLPLMFQIAFGYDPFTSGLLLLAVFAGNLAMKPATTAVLLWFGFRSTLVWNGALAMATILACALLTAQTPVAIVVALLFVSGLARSMQFTALNTLSFCDLDKATMSGANTLFSMLQQMGNAMGIATAAIALRLAASLTHADQSMTTVGDFRIAFLVIGVAGLIGVLWCGRLPADAGEVLRRPSGAAAGSTPPDGQTPPQR